MNLTSALLKQIITQEDFDTWGNLRENYLANEYQALYRAMDTHIKNFNALPTFDDLKLSIRDRKLQEKKKLLANSFLKFCARDLIPCTFLSGRVDIELNFSSVEANNYAGRF